MIERQSARKPYLIVISSAEKLSNFVQTDILNKKIQNLINRCWPGPVTIIFNALPIVPGFLTSKDKTIALRCPDHKGLQQLLASFDGLFSTSANKAGAPIPRSFAEIDGDIIENVDYVVADKSSDVVEIVPSTIIDISQVSDGGNIKVIREGAYSIELLEGYYGSEFEK